MLPTPISRNAFGFSRVGVVIKPIVTRMRTISTALAKHVRSLSLRQVFVTAVSLPVLSSARRVNLPFCRSDGMRPSHLSMHLAQVSIATIPLAGCSHILDSGPVGARSILQDMRRTLRVGRAVCGVLFKVHHHRLAMRALPLQRPFPFPYFGAAGT
jgi:hypothetical protein